MRRFRHDRRNVMDRIRLSEFFALICTGFMLLTLFLLSSAGESLIVKTGSLSAGFSAKGLPMKAVVKEVPSPSLAKTTDVEALPTSKKNRRPTRSIDQFDTDFSN